MKPTLIPCLVTGLMAGLALPAGAGNLVERPGDCSLTAVIQFEECWFQRSYTCGSGAGTTFRIEMVSAGDLISVEHRSPDLMQLGFAIEDGPIQSFAESTVDVDGRPQEVLEAVAGHFEYQLTYSIFGMRNPMSVVIDQQAPSPAGEIDGIAFHKVVQATELRMQPPMQPVSGETVLMYVAGGELYFVEGGSSDFPAGTVLGPHKPVTIILAGEGAADVTEPKFGCEILGSLSVEVGAHQV